MNAASHLDAKELRDYMLGRLPLDAYKSVESHLSSCPSCRAKAETLDGCTDTFLNSLRHASREDSDDSALARLIAKAKDLPGRDPETDEPVKIVDGYEYLCVIARSGMGVIYLARHLLLNDLRAIKRPRPKAGIEREVLLSRFRREVVSVGKLKHDHIVRAHDAGADENGPYLIMEYLDGKSLQWLVANRGALPVAVACELIRQAAIALQAAHERGLVHRDIKPSNLMLARCETGVRVVVIDWGLVKRTSEERPSDDIPADDLTVSQMAMGTPDYIAPEQIHTAGRADIRADIYSLGTTLYCLLAGQPPFHERRPLQKLVGHEEETFPPLDEKRDDVPGQLIAVIDRMVEKSPDNRFATPREVTKAIQPFCCGPESPSLLGLLDTPEKKAPPYTPTPSRSKKKILDAETDYVEPHKKVEDEVEKKRPWRFVAIAVLAVVMFCGVLFGGTIIRFVSNKGVLVVEVNDPNVELTVKQDELIVADKSTKREFTLKAGAGEVEVYEKASGLKLATKRFTIGRGDKETVVVEVGGLKDPKKQLERTAEVGDPEAAYRLGEAYRTGEGVELSFVDAAKWYKRAADKDHPAGLYWLHMCQLMGRGMNYDMAGGVKSLMKAEKLGHLGARVLLAEWYCRQGTGNGVMRDTHDVYSERSGITQDKVKARELMKNVSSVDDELSLMVYAAMNIDDYYIDILPRRDIQKGLKLLEEAKFKSDWAAGGGHSWAIDSYISVFGLIAKSSSENQRAAEKKWYEDRLPIARERAVRGDPWECMFLLGYYNFECTPRNLPIAEHWQKEAIRHFNAQATKGDPESMLMLAWIKGHGEGRGTEGIKGDRVAWVRKAADCGDARGFYGLGEFYEASKDTDLAAKCYRKAEELGLAYARERLNSMMKAMGKN